MKILKVLIVACLGFLFSCGGARTTTVADGSAPILLSITPLSVSRGSTVTLSGSGFSIVPQENVILLGGTSTPASNYITNSSGEAITFIVPNNTPLGDQPLTVIVEGFADSISNPITLTITP
ncbi:MAG: IPT/TIG domain-containing protein [Deltaproteobacteria bacterium]|nr:MAG: IPT/TIG domain-containing protein [Deltaproteobacteria bacterium]